MSPSDDVDRVDKGRADNAEAPVDPTAVEVWQQLAYTFNALLKLSREVLKEHDVTGPQYGVLRILQRRGPSTMSELSAELLVTAGNITGLVDRLVRDGLVERETDPADRRVVRTRLTDAGRTLVERAGATHHRFLTRLLGTWSQRDEKRLRDLLERLNDTAQSRL
jgi:DNA-binding MarR family transcriptional regulator